MNQGKSISLFRSYQGLPAEMKMYYRTSTIYDYSTNNILRLVYKGSRRATRQVNNCNCIFTVCCKMFNYYRNHTVNYKLLYYDSLATKMKYLSEIDMQIYQ